VGFGSTKGTPDGVPDMRLKHRRMMKERKMRSYLSQRRAAWRKETENNMRRLAVKDKEMKAAAGKEETDNAGKATTQEQTAQE